MGSLPIDGPQAIARCDLAIEVETLRIEPQVVCADMVSGVERTHRNSACSVTPITRNQRAMIPYAIMNVAQPAETTG